ncbi:MAG: phosphohydrolase [Hyphomicrobiaceae bacterium]|nr:MAG: phosphohydrolase [Hyphomicrobiaceae bacterium]
MLHDLGTLGTFGRPDYVDDVELGRRMRTAAITTSSGRTVCPFAPDPTTIDPGDIAHALANKCRWNGHTSRFYSVAQHSVLVARYTVAPADRLWGLLHDAGEAYLPDVPSPIKPFCPSIITAENNLLAAVAIAFGLPTTIPATVHYADLVVRSAEARDLMRLDVTRAPWSDYPPFADGIVALPPDAAERLFWDEFYKLTKSASSTGKDS